MNELTEVSVDVCLGEACWDIDVARRVVSALPDVAVSAPPRLPVFEALSALVAAGVERIDPPMVMSRIMRDRLTGWDDTARWLPQITTGNTGPQTVGWHLNAIGEEYARYQLSQVATRTQQALSGDLDEAIRVAREGLDRVSLRTTDAPPTVGELLMPHLERLETKDTTRLIPTGLPDLDLLLGGGFRPGQLVTVGAATGAGKSLLLGGFARQATIREALPVLFSSLEMSRTELMDRVISAETRVDLGRIIKRDLTEQDWEKLSRRIDALTGSRLHIDDNPHRTVGDIAATARPVMPAMVCVDYVQLLTTPHGVRHNSRQEEVSAFSRGLKLLARELGCVVVAAAQLNRAADQRSDKRPRLSDLRESGAIAQDSDVVLLLDRDENDDTLGTDATLIVAKQRSGPLGAVSLSFSGHNARFDSLAWEYQP